MKLISLPAFVDNYIWMLHDGRKAWVVDPGAAAPVLRALDEYRLELAGILVTHHHGDHVGGLADLHAHLTGPVFGPAREDIPGPCTPLADGDEIEVLGLHFRILDVPGHTRGHIAYYSEDARRDDGIGSALLFCGDTLFSGGCGRLFEGTPEQMHASLSALAALPADTAVCCAHEYTLSNLRFARAVEPDNAAVIAYSAWCESQRLHDRPTLPSTIGNERRINPFLRCDVPEVAAAARRREPAATRSADVLGSLRRWKNEFQ
jgi:hydroxyacylglutathione hydrolase